MGSRFSLLVSRIHFLGETFSIDRKNEENIASLRTGLPAAVNGWNKQKAGIDGISRLFANVKDCHLRTGLHDRPNLSFFKTLLMNAHLTLRVDEVVNTMPAGTK